MLETVPLVTIDGSVAGPGNLVYSTDPKVALGEDGHDYFIKGPDPDIAFPELAGCLLAKLVGLPVAPVAVCTFAGVKYCGSQKVADIGRNVEPFLQNPARLVNFQDMYAAIAVDIWLANTDRNMGNVLARAAGRGQASLVMIDFEKSRTLGPSPIMQSTMADPKLLWPREDLGRLLKAKQPIPRPLKAVARIQEVAKTKDIADVIGAVVAAFGAVEWADGSKQVLTKRGAEIGKLVNEIWAL